jgi:hypothetical protein
VGLGIGGVESDGAFKRLQGGEVIAGLAQNHSQTHHGIKVVRAQNQGELVGFDCFEGAMEGLPGEAQVVMGIGIRWRDLDFAQAASGGFLEAAKHSEHDAHEQIELGQRWRKGHGSLKAQQRFRIEFKTKKQEAQLPEGFHALRLKGKQSRINLGGLLGALLREVLPGTFEQQPALVNRWEGWGSRVTHGRYDRVDAVAPRNSPVSENWNEERRRMQASWTGKNQPEWLRL